LNNITKASFVLGAIGGFLIALIRIPGNLGWTLAADAYQLHFQILILAWILIIIGFFGLWRESGNVIPLVSAICFILLDITRPLLTYLVTYTLLLPVGFDPAVFYAIGMIFGGAGWIAAGIFAWLHREEFSQYSIVAALVFVSFGAATFLALLIGSGGIGGWWKWFQLANGIVTGIYFLDAART
jgi:hypothetical protein